LQEKKPSKLILVLGRILLIIAFGLFIVGVTTRGWQAIVALVLAIGLGWLALVLR
jgi:hypothetical protein